MQAESLQAQRQAAQTMNEEPEKFAEW